MKMYRVISKKEFDVVMSGGIISHSKFNTSTYSKGKEGVFFFPKISCGEARTRNGFFIPWAQGKNTMVIMANIPCDRVVAHGVGYYGTGDMPEVLVNQYGREDIICYIPLDMLDKYDESREYKIGSHHIDGIGKYDSRGGFVYLKYYRPSI